MPSLPQRLKRLERWLDSLPIDDEPMLLSELDGFLAGIIVCPEQIMSGEWLPLIWGEGGEDAEPAFDDPKQAQKALDLIMQHYNTIVGDLRAARHKPIFMIDGRNEDILWELWVDGFENAMKLRPESWELPLYGDQETQLALAGMIALADISRSESDLSEEEIRELTDNAPELIPCWVQILNDWRIEQEFSSHPETAMPQVEKVGRNAPCPCGSGKKYKKCCGLN
ncbi:MAG: UPF0149 family protein [Sphingomonadales bacterium]|nr:UPF0149 family protein [Sphingomonadales bacterium]